MANIRQQQIDILRGALRNVDAYGNLRLVHPVGPPVDSIADQEAASNAERLLQGMTPDGDTLLHIAARLDDVALVRAISDSCSAASDVTRKNNRKETPLHCAAATGSNTMIGLLISLAGSEEKKRQLLREQNDNGETCLHEAVRCGEMVAVEKLFQADVDVHDVLDLSLALVEISDKKGISPLYLAATLQELDIVKFLAPINRDANVQYPPASYAGPGRKTALHAAVLLNEELSGHLAGWKKELIGKADESGNTPLHLLASTKDKIIMKLLLGLDKSAGYHPDNEGSMPIHVAAANGSLEIVKLLSERLPSCCWAIDNLGQTILHIAVKNGKKSVVEYVCSGKRFVQIFNTRDTDGNTALHLAVQQGNQLIFCKLMRRSEICLNLMNKKEHTPLDLAQLRLPPGISLVQVPRQWIMYALVLAGADYGTRRSDHLSKDMAQVDKEKESELIGKSSGLVAVCAVLILTVAFAVPFTVTRFHDSWDQDIVKSFAYRMFMIFEGMAFALSAIATTCSTLAGFSFTDRGTRLFYLKAGGVCLRVAAMSITLVFTVGVYVAVSPVDNLITGFVYLFGALVIISQLTPFWMMLLHAWALFLRLGCKRWCANVICALPRQRQNRISKRYRALCVHSIVLLFAIVLVCSLIFELGLLSAFSTTVGPPA